MVGLYGGVTAMTDGPENSVWFVAHNLEDFGVIDRMGLDGSLTGEFTVPNTPDYAQPSSLAAGPDGDVWFTEDYYENSEYHQLIGRTTIAGKIAEFPIASGTADRPIGQITPGPDGDMWFIEEGGIMRVSPTGTMSWVLPNLGEPTDIATGSDGSVWFTNHSYIGRISPGGELSQFPTSGTNTTSIVRGSDGSMWFAGFVGFAAEANTRIGLITPTGRISEYTLPRKPTYSGMAMAEGADGNLWFVDSGSEALWTLTPTGSFTSFPVLLSGDNEPQEIIDGPDGNLWLAVPSDTPYEDGFEVHIGRFVTPFAPVNLELPQLSGNAVAGQALSVSEGTWSHGPNAITYQWQLCDAAGDECANVDGQVGATNILTSTDIGHTLRAIVTASNTGGALPVASPEVSAVIDAPARPTSAIPQVPPGRGVLPPLIAATMTCGDSSRLSAPPPSRVARGSRAHLWQFADRHLPRPRVSVRA